MRPFIGSNVRLHHSLDDDLGVGRNQQVAGFTSHQLGRRPPPTTRRFIFHRTVSTRRDRAAGGKGQQWVHSDDDGDRRRNSVFPIVENVVLAARPGRRVATSQLTHHRQGRFVLDHDAVGSHVQIAGQRSRATTPAAADESPAIEFMPNRRRQNVDVQIVTFDDNFFARPRLQRPGRDPIIHSAHDATLDHLFVGLGIKGDR